MRKFIDTYPLVVLLVVVTVLLFSIGYFTGYMKYAVISWLISIFAILF